MVDQHLQNAAAVLAGATVGKLETVTPADAAEYYFQYLDALVKQEIHRKVSEKVRENVSAEAGGRV